MEEYGQLKFCPEICKECPNWIQSPPARANSRCGLTVAFQLQSLILGPLNSLPSLSSWWMVLLPVFLQWPESLDKLLMVCLSMGCLSPLQRWWDLGNGADATLLPRVRSGRMDPINESVQSLMQQSTLLRASDNLYSWWLRNVMWVKFSWVQTVHNHKNKLHAGKTCSSIEALYNLNL